MRTLKAIWDGIYYTWWWLVFIEGSREGSAATAAASAASAIAIYLMTRLKEKR
jgi:hypothetical protein